MTIQSAEENDFVVSYSKKVWKEPTNMWLGMYYDTDSKWGAPLEYCIMGANTLGTISLNQMVSIVEYTNRKEYETI